MADVDKELPDLDAEQASNWLLKQLGKMKDMFGLPEASTDPPEPSG